MTIREQKLKYFNIIYRSNYHLEFRSTEPNGLIYYLGSSFHEDFLAIYLIDGNVATSFNCGSGKAKILTLKRYDDNQWHSVGFRF